MDKATTFGLVAGSVLIVGAVFIGGQVGLFINIPSVLITVGGSIAGTVVCFTTDQISQTMSITRKAFNPPSLSSVEVIQTLVDFATTARRDGILALEEKSAEVDNEFLKRGVQLAVDGTAPEVIREVLETELAYLEERHKIGADLYATLGAFAPAFGLIGTLIGLVQMLAQIDDPSAIGPGMAVALLTTLYGAIQANLFCLPLEKKLKNRSKEEILSREIVIEGVMSIQAGDNPRIVQDKLKAFVAPADRAAFEEEEEK